MITCGTSGGLGSLTAMPHKHVVRTLLPRYPGGMLLLVAVAEYQEAALTERVLDQRPRPSAATAPFHLVDDVATPQLNPLGNFSAGSAGDWIVGS
jgi:hypothetical protein